MKKIKAIDKNFKLGDKKKHIKEVIKEGGFKSCVKEDIGKSPLQLLIEKHLFKLLYSKKEIDVDEKVSKKEQLKRVFGGFT